MGKAAQEFAVSEHGLDRVVGLYVGALEEGAGGEQVRNAVREDVARAAVETGIDARSRVVDDVVASTRELGL